MIWVLQVAIALAALYLARTGDGLARDGEAFKEVPLTGLSPPEISKFGLSIFKAMAGWREKTDKLPKAVTSRVWASNDGPGGLHTANVSWLLSP